MKSLVGLLMTMTLSLPTKGQAKEFLASEVRPSGESRAATLSAETIDGRSEGGRGRPAVELTKSLAVYTVALMAAGAAREIAAQTAAANLERRTLSTKERAGIWMAAIDQQVDHILDANFSGKITSGLLLSVLVDGTTHTLSKGEAASALKSLVAGGLSVTAFMVASAAYGKMMDHSSRLLNEKDFNDYMSDTKNSWRLIPEMYKNAGTILADGTKREKYLSDLWTKSILNAHFVIPTGSIATGAYVGGRVAGGAGALGGGVIGALTSFLPSAVMDPINEKAILSTRAFSTREDLRHCASVASTMMRFSPSASENELTQIRSQLDNCQTLTENLISIYFQRLAIKLMDLRSAQGKLKAVQSNGNIQAANDLNEHVRAAKESIRRLLSEMAEIYPSRLKQLEYLKNRAVTASHHEILDGKITDARAASQLVDKLLARLNPDASGVVQEKCQNYLTALYGETDYFREKYLASDLNSKACANEDVPATKRLPLESSATN